MRLEGIKREKLSWKDIWKMDIGRGKHLLRAAGNVSSYPHDLNR